MPLMEQVCPFLLRLGRRLIFPLSLILGVSVLGSFLRGADWLFFLLGVFALFIWLCITATRLVIALWNKNWSGVSIVIATIGLTVLLARPLFLAGDYVHLVVMYPYYQDRIADTNEDRVIFDWGGDGIAGSTTDYYLVYDRVGTLQKDGTLRLSAGGMDLPVFVQHLFGRFYLASYS